MAVTTEKREKKTVDRPSLRLPLPCDGGMHSIPLRGPYYLCSCGRLLCEDCDRVHAMVTGHNRGEWN